MRLFDPQVVAPFGGKQKPVLGILFGITEVFEPDGSFAAPVGFRLVTNELIWLFKCKKLPTPGLKEQKSMPILIYSKFHCRDFFDINAKLTIECPSIIKSSSPKLWLMPLKW